MVEGARKVAATTTNNNVAQSAPKSQSPTQNNSEQKSDRGYARAVKRDDMAAAARMVDEAANAALAESLPHLNHAHIQITLTPESHLPLSFP